MQNLISGMTTAMALAWPWPLAADLLHDFDLPDPPRAASHQPRTVEQVLDRHVPDIAPNLRARFEARGVAYPPPALTLIGLKEEMRLEIWAEHDHQPLHIHSYPIRDASGLPGPKRRRGDFQVPEGIYQIDAFNPNSSFHLSLRLDYPNDFDQQMGKRDGRNDLGSNIFIHGGDYSEGCLAIGDPAIEELFVLIAHVGLENSRIIIAPHDPRVRSLFPIPRGLPDWTNALYERLERSMAPYTASNQAGAIPADGPANASGPSTRPRPATADSTSTSARP